MGRQALRDVRWDSRRLFTASFLLDDFLENQGFFGAASVVLASASTKTAPCLPTLAISAEPAPLTGC